MDVQKFNDLLGQELGRNIYGEPLFMWKHSDEMFWPAVQTGRKVLTKRMIEVPIVSALGTTLEKVETEEAVPEYRAERMVRRSAWYMTKWLSPQELIVGTCLRRGIDYPQESADRPWPQEALNEKWQALFPGADFPHRGWRVTTDAYLPRSPHDPSVPNLADTEYFIRCIREQTRMNLPDLVQDMLAQMDWKDAQSTKRLEDDIRDGFPAMLNPNPGTRSGFVSFPGTKLNH